MSYYLDVLKDNPIAFLPLDESSFTVANDISGCKNNGTYEGTFSNKILPLIYGGTNATKITSSSYIEYSVTKDYAQNISKGGLAVKQYSDNDFSLEIWFKPKTLSNNVYPVMADITNDIGLFYNNGTLIFDVQSNVLTYKLSFSNKAMHIVARYSVNSIELYVDGSLVRSKSLNNFKFNNTYVLFQSGPTSESDEFLIDAPAIYRYGLNKNRIKSHYMSGLKHVNPIQIVSPDLGILMPLTGQTIAPIFKYEYDSENKWKKIIDNSVYYDNASGFISFPQTLEPQIAEFVGYDIINIPNSIDIVSSKVEWRGDNGISIFTSIDGVNYDQCVNGSFIPNLNKESFTQTNALYIKVMMESLDTTIDLPRLSLLNFYFYADKKLYAQNFGYFADSNKEYDISLFNYPTLLRHPNAGVKTTGSGGFDIQVDQDIQTIEFMFTPSTLENNILFYSPESGSYPETKFGWNGTGTLKSNIYKVYLNGQDVTSFNFKNQLTAGEPHHVVLVFTSAIQNTFQFNYLSSTNYGPSCNYHNLGMYGYQMSAGKALEHYNLYVGRPSTIASGSSFSLTESSVKYYNNEWIVVSSN